MRNNGNVFVDNFQQLEGGPGPGASLAPHRQSMDPDSGHDEQRRWLDLRRPYFDRNGDRALTVNLGRWTKQDSKGGEPKPIREHITARDYFDRHGIMLPVWNATSLRKEEWLQLDRAVHRAARWPLKFWLRLMGSGNVYGGFNGMAKEILEYENMSDVGEAVVDMDGTTDNGRVDAPRFQLEGLPLVITHANFWVTQRRQMTSMNTGTPFSTTMAEGGARRIGESLEKVSIGVDTGIKYGGLSTQQGGYGRASQVYGLMNFPPRLTYNTMTVPTGTNPEATLADVLNMMEQLRQNKFNGPYVLYHSTDWQPFLDNDYARAVVGVQSIATSLSLRERILRLGDIKDVVRLDFMRPTATAPQDVARIAATHRFTMILVQDTPDVVRAVNGMDLTTIQWEEQGGLKLMYKLMTIQVPQLFADFYGNCGVLHARTAT